MFNALRIVKVMYETVPYELKLYDFDIKFQKFKV